MEAKFEIKEALEELNETKLKQVYTMTNIMAQKHRQDTKKALLTLDDLCDMVLQFDSSEVKEANKAFDQMLEGLSLDKVVANKLSDLVTAMCYVYEQRSFVLGFRQAAALLMGGNHD